MNQDEVKREIVGMYDRAAALYGQVGTRQFTYFADALVDRLSILPGAHILDVACGRGALAFAAAAKAGERGLVVGIDLARGMVRETKAEVRRRDLKAVEIVLMDADDPAFAENSFDLILCGFALHFLDYPLLLPKLLRLLKPGGCFAASMPYVPQQAAAANWKWLFELTKAVFPPEFTPPAFWIAPRRLNKPELAENALQEAGFVDIRIENEEAILYFKDEHDWWDWEWSQGSRFWLEGMSPEGLEHFQRESFRNLAAMKTDQGIPMPDGARFAIGYKAV